MKTAIAAVFLLSAALAVARAEDRRNPKLEELGSRPIEITADRLSADSAKNSVTFEGSVVAKQGDVTLTCNKLFAEYSKAAGAIEKITAEGSVTVLQAGKEARAQQADFYNLEQRVVLTGGAVLQQGENTLKGETVTIYLRENRSVVAGGQGKRVEAVINPKGALETKEKEGR